MARLRITYNSPVVLTFALLAVAAFGLTHLSETTKLWFVAWPKLLDTRSYVGLFSHILGHASWEHLLGNFMLILLLGPILEERHGSSQLLVMILLTALFTGLLNLAIGDGFILGASGVVFMMILLASMANVRGGEIPLTFIAVAIIYMGGEIVRSFRSDQISQLAHLAGGLAGATFGFMTARRGRHAAKAAPKGSTQAELQKILGGKSK